MTLPTEIYGAFMLAAALAGSPALASPNDITARFNECRIIDNKDDRLKCFDGIASVSTRTSPDAGPAPDDDWDYSSAIDKLTDEERHIVSRLSTSQSGRLVIKCDSAGKNSLYVHILTPQFLGTMSNRMAAHVIKYRFGRGAVTSAKFIASDRSAAIIERDAVRKFLDQARSEQPLVLSATGYDYKSVELEFDMTGAKSAIEKVAKGCRH